MRHAARPRCFAGIATVLFHVSAILGCSAQTEPGYKGEPLATVRGDVTTTVAGPQMGIDAAILWVTGATDTRPKLVGERTSIAATFPASFELTAFQPPPESAALESHAVSGASSGVWLGYFVALSSTAAAENVEPASVLGIDRSHALLYFDHDGAAIPETITSLKEVDEVTNLALLFKVTPTKGYHLALIDVGSVARREQYDRCVFNGVCPAYVGRDSFTRSRKDWSHARCLTLFSTTCTITSDPSTPAEKSENDRCDELMKAAGQVSFTKPDGAVQMQNDCPVPWTVVLNTGGFASPVNIEIGKTFWDAFL